MHAYQDAAATAGRPAVGSGVCHPWINGRGCHQKDINLLASDKTRRLAGVNQGKAGKLQPAYTKWLRCGW